MRIFSSEFAHNYATYTFGYAHYAEREATDSLQSFYEQGYLPYSGSPKARNIFYLARSARIALASFTLNSENRRIAKKFDGVFTKKRIPLSTFVLDEAVYQFCIDYFKAQHGEHIMPRERLQYIFESGLVTNIIEYREEGAVVAYVLEVEEPPVGHYWYSFYAPSYVGKSLGLWLMLDCIRDAKERGLTHYYLGTVYGPKALYKTNFEPLEWWNGEMWSTDIGLLRERSRSDESRSTTVTDPWKDNMPPFA